MSTVKKDSDIVIISGGTATNSLVSMFQCVSSSLSFCMPISDNGGSTSEILRVLGGPAIGDIRSRITRLIPDEGFKRLLSHRLSEDPKEAKNEWTSIVEGDHQIWNGLDIQCKEMIRSFLIHVHMELLKKSRNPNTNFRFELASIGNLLLTGVRLFVGSLDSAIELLLRITRIDPNIQILPCLNTNYTYHISALLQNGDIITGQSQISHPSESITEADINDSTDYFQEADISISENPTIFPHHYNQLYSTHEDIPYQHPDLLISQLRFSKDVNSPLQSPINRIFYINQYGEEIHPRASSRTIKSLDNAEVIVYSIGSLMTSIIPILILKGMGYSIKNNSRAKKILLLNGNHDRETSGLTAYEFIQTIFNAALYSYGENLISTINYNDIITHLFYLETSEIKIDLEKIETLGIKCIKIPNDHNDAILDDIFLYDIIALQNNLQQII
ncbi:hypothetical protein WICMUC_003562 [Wickerhamomyces mucosus]|uniref:Uncharacterized protein n=1 Tax=Wickerhamomyces mucosus TaxID=1378264 RepID=A0A9P8PLM1_9ASCO|nr:hypothetical protein WICMUC_003562 [Wickerhamomyces mucosus]